MKRAFTCLLATFGMALAGCGVPACDGLDCGHDHDHAHAHAHDDGHEHAHHAVHSTIGPHQGQLVELGDEEYHAEWLIDEASDTLTVYLLDAQARKAVGAEASVAKINLVHDGTARQFSLSAYPQAFDASGESSRFVSSDADICHELEHARAQLVVSIRGKQYRGTIEADHHEMGQHTTLLK